MKGWRILRLSFHNEMTITSQTNYCSSCCQTIHRHDIVLPNDPTIASSNFGRSYLSAMVKKGGRRLALWKTSLKRTRQRHQGSFTFRSCRQPNGPLNVPNTAERKGAQWISWTMDVNGQLRMLP